MEIKVRPVNLDDAHGIQENLFSISNSDEIQKTLKQDIEKMVEGEYLRCVAVSEQGEIAGQIEFGIPASPVKKHTANISGLVVAEKFKKQKVASKLFNFGLIWTVSKGIKLLVLSVRKGTEAEEIYRHWGFEIYGELKSGISEPWEGGNIYDEVFLVKNL